MDEFATSFWLSAVLTGVAFGYVIQRGGFCLTRAISNLALMGGAGILRAHVLAMLVAVVGVHLLTGLGLVEVPVRPFRWIANILGGLLFGVGMILAGGCSGSTWYRVGEGAIGAWVILLGFALGGHRRARRRRAGMARARTPRAGAWEMGLAPHGGGGGNPDRGGLVDVHVRGAPRGHYVRGEHRTCPHLSAGGISQPGHVEHGPAGRHAHRRLSRRVAGG